MSQHVITAEPRTLSTKGALNSLRRDGRIPAVMYNRHGKSVPLALGAKDFSKAVIGVSESTIVQLHVGADSFDCLIKDRQLDWLRGKIDHVDFFEVEKDVVIRAKVPVHLIGNPIGVREGGILENPVHEIEVECLPKDMPEKFEIDISGLHANHSIHVRDISHADTVRVHSSLDQVVVLVKYAKGEATETEEAEAPAAAEPAAKA
jgi:large subunit ribosomal protein L25